MIRREKDFESTLCHFNPNHDPKTGRFTKTSIQQKRAMASAKTKSDVDDILSTLTGDELRKFGVQGSARQIFEMQKNNTLYLDASQGEHVVKRVLKKVGDTPVAFFDILHDSDDHLVTALATRNDDRYRGKGYASKVVKQGMKWLEKHADDLSYSYIDWGVRKDNTPSINIAKKSGFVHDPSSDSEWWTNYTKRLK